MKMTLEQTRLVGLTLELDCKAREYRALCNQQEKLKTKIVDCKDSRWIELQARLRQNEKDIKKIKNELEFLKY